MMQLRCWRRRFHPLGAAAVGYIVFSTILAMIPGSSGVMRHVVLEGLIGRERGRATKLKNLWPFMSPRSSSRMDTARARGLWRKRTGGRRVLMSALNVKALVVMM